VGGFKDVFQCPAGSEVSGDPTGANAPRRLQDQDLPAESECPERKSTGPFAGTILVK